LLGLGLLTVFLVKSCTPSVTTTTTTKREDTGRDKVPDVATVSGDLTSTFTSLTKSLTGITNVDEAKDALPKLKELSGKLDDVKELVGKLPVSGKSKIADLIRPVLGKLGDQFANLLWIPGVATIVKPTMNAIMDKAAALGDLKVPQTPQLSSDLASVFSSLTETLKGVKDKASAEEALTKLNEVNDQLEVTKAAVDKLPEDSKSTISKLVAKAMADAKTGFKELIEKVLAIAGVGDKFKTVVNAIMGKLKDIAG
jgi:hypothetical protein